MAHLDKESPVPLYYQLQETLRRKIENGDFPQGNAIPPEPELQKMFKVSRVTVRRAIQELVYQGLLTTEQGRGTFVRGQKVTQNLNVISSWAETMIARGMRPETRSIKIETVAAPPIVAKWLQIGPDTPVVKVERLRYAAGEPVTIMTNYLREDLVPGLSEKDVGDSLYETLETKYRITFIRAHEMVEARAAGLLEAKLLGIRRGEPLMHVTRITYGIGDRPFEVVMASSRADRYSYSVDLYGRPRR